MSREYERFANKIQEQTGNKLTGEKKNSKKATTKIKCNKKPY